jgi:glycosidase
MLHDPNNPDAHGDVPVSLTNKIKELKPIYQSNPAARYPGLDGVYDFIFSGISRDSFLNMQSPSQLSAYLNGRDYNEGAQNDMRLSWTLFEIHDWSRLLRNVSFAISDSPHLFLFVLFSDVLQSLTLPFQNAQRPGDSNLILNALAYVLMMQGSPIIYYGAEQGFNGNCDLGRSNLGNAYGELQGVCSGYSDALARQCMFDSCGMRLGSAVGTINDLRYLGPIGNADTGRNWTADPFLRRDHDVYKSTRYHIKLRNSCFPLKYGFTTVRFADDYSKLAAFSRINRESGKEIVVVVNFGENGQNVGPIPVNGNHGAPRTNIWKDIRNPTFKAYYGFSNGNAFIYPENNQRYMPAKSIAVYVNEDDIKYTPEGAFCKEGLPN